VAGSLHGGIKVYKKYLRGNVQQIYQNAEAMAGRVRGLYDGNSKLVTVVGLGHLAGLKTKLEDLEPKVMTLAEYDSV
jgi:hypothetical protein